MHLLEEALRQHVCIRSARAAVVLFVKQLHIASGRRVFRPAQKRVSIARPRLDRSLHNDRYGALPGRSIDSASSSEGARTCLQNTARAFRYIELMFLGSYASAPNAPPGSVAVVGPWRPKRSRDADSDVQHNTITLSVQHPLPPLLP